VEIELQVEGSAIRILRTSLLRTARKLMQGDVYVPAAVWSGQ
jgi:2-methylaconitate cis-trans-isomerase PrpF